MLDARLQLVDAATRPPPTTRPSRQDAEAAIRTLIRFTGDAPSREACSIRPPVSYVRTRNGSAARHRSGSLACARFETAGYDDVVLLRDIPVRSTCEHHMAPIRGVAHVAYLPGERVVGISNSRAWSTPTPAASRSRSA